MSWNRRQWLQATSQAASAGLMAGACSLVALPGLARPVRALRPPGALDEPDFLGACVRCGLCVRACPPQNLKLADWGTQFLQDVPPQGSSASSARQGGALAVGTPFFEARDVPCEMCEDIPCVKACPSGALDPALTDIRQSRMGLAVLIDQESCLNFLGLRCDVCYRVCPVQNEAITLENIHNPRSDRHAMLLPTVHAEHCTGCGKCERSCVLERAAIKVMPRSLAQGAIGEHYKKSWEKAS